MTTIKIEDGKDENTLFEIVVEVDFEKPVNSVGLNYLAQYITNIINGDTSSYLTPILVYLELTPDSVKSRFKFLHKMPITQPMQELSSSEISRLRINFIFYFISKIDEKYKILDGDLPSDFRYFLNLPTQLNSYYGWTLTS
jgi:hypothetical protein